MILKEANWQAVEGVPPNLFNPLSYSGVHCGRDDPARDTRRPRRFSLWIDFGQTWPEGGDVVIRAGHLSSPYSRLPSHHLQHGAQFCWRAILPF